MTHYKIFQPKTILLSSIGLAAILLCSTPACKAQEVSPAIFTDSGVEDVYPAKKPLPKNTQKIETASRRAPALSGQAFAANRKTRLAARKRDVVTAPNI